MLCVLSRCSISFSSIESGYWRLLAVQPIDESGVALGRLVQGPVVAAPLRVEARYVSACT